MALSPCPPEDKRSRILFAAPFFAILATIVGIGLALIAPQQARAHARYLGSDPAAGTALTVSPAQVTISFSEQVSSQFSSIEVWDRARRPVQQGTTSAAPNDANSLRVALRPNLPVGSYVVLWRVVSGIDGHLTQGNFTFIIAQAGQAIPTPDPTSPFAGVSTGGDSGQSSLPSPLRVILRGIILFCMAGLLGGALFTTLILAGDQTLTNAAGKRFTQVGFLLAMLLEAALIGDMAFQLGDVLGTAGGDFLPAAQQFITGTDFGRYWLVRVVCALGLVLLFAAISLLKEVPPPAAGVWNVAVSVSATLVAAEALSSHAAAAGAGSGIPVGLISDAVHLLTTGAWIGGLLYLAAILLPVLHRDGVSRETRLATLGKLVPRFSKLATGSLILLIGTGVVNLALHTLDPPTIAASTYGQVLIFKHLLFIPLLALGFVNNSRVAPHFVKLLAGAEGESEATTTRFTRLIRGEVVIASAVLLCAAGLTLLPPPVVGASNQVSNQPSRQAATPGPTALPASMSMSNRGVRVELETFANPLGDRFNITLRREDTTTPDLTMPMRLRLRITPQDFDAGTTTLTPEQVGQPTADSATYSAGGQLLTLSGGYLVRVEVERRDADAVEAAFRVTLDDSGALTATTAPLITTILDTSPSPAISGTVTLDIRLRDGDDKPVENAEVTLTALMPVHGHVEGGLVAEPVAGEAGLYRVAVEMQMSGGWLVIIEVSLPGQPPLRTDASFDVTDPATIPTASPP